MCPKFWKYVAISRFDHNVDLTVLLRKSISRGEITLWTCCLTKACRALLASIAWFNLFYVHKAAVS